MVKRIVLIFIFFILPFQWGNAMEYDPTQPDALVEVKLPLKLSQVVISPTKRIALIDGKFYQEDDVVDGYQIIAIHMQEVILQRDQQQWILKLFSTKLKETNQ